MGNSARIIINANVYPAQAQGTLRYAAYGARVRFNSVAQRDVNYAADKSFLMGLTNQQYLGDHSLRALSAAANTDDQGANIPTMTFVPSPVECLINTPFLSLWQAIDLDYFYLDGAMQDGWNDDLSNEIIPWIDASSVLCYNNYADWQTAAGQWVGVRSAFQYPTNPIICLALYRNDPSSTMPNGVTPSTCITFGDAGGTGTGFILQINYNSAPMLLVKDNNYTRGHWVPVHPHGGGRELRTLGNMSVRGEKTPGLLWIAPMAGGIAVSEDAFSSVNFFPLRWGNPTTDNPYGEAPYVPAGWLGIHHNAGQFGFAVVPNGMTAEANLQTPLIRTSFNVAASGGDMPAWARLRQDPVLDNNGSPMTNGAAVAMLTNNVSGSRLPTCRIPPDGCGVEYFIVSPSVLSVSNFASTGNSKRPGGGHAGAALSFQTVNCPRIYDLIAGQSATLQTPASTSPVSKNANMKSFSLTASSENVDITGEITLEASRGRELGLVDLQAPRNITISGEWTDADGSTILDASPQASGWVAEAHAAGAGGAARLSLPFYGVGKHISGTRNLSDCFPLDSFAVVEALTEACAWAGIRSDFTNFEDLGLYLNSGPHDRELYWYSESGDRLEALMKEICVYACNASLRVAPSGWLATCCPHCGATRTANNVTLHYGKGPASPGCLAYDTARNGDPLGLDFRFVTSTLSYEAAGLTDPDPMTCLIAGENSISKPAMEIEHYYFNCVRIKGPDYAKDDDSTTADITDWVSVNGGATPAQSNGYVLGYKKTHERTYPWADTPQIRARVASWLFDQMSRRPEFVEVTVPYQPQVLLGNTFRIWGSLADDLGASKKKYRVWSYSHHDVTPAGGRERATTLLGRFCDVCTE